MKNILRTIALVVLLSSAAACNKPYDPIGPNKPSPVLIISPLELAYDGDGGEITSKISTNAETVKIDGDLPAWVESAVVNEDNTGLTVKVKENADGLDVRRGVIKLVCASGNNSATQFVKLFQAGKGSKIEYASFSGKTLPSGWSAEDPSAISVGNGYLDFQSSNQQGFLYDFGVDVGSGNQGGLIYTNGREFNPDGAPYYFSVDIKMNGGEGGLALYLNDDAKQLVYIFMGYNSNTNHGGIWVKNGPSWCAMDDGTIGSGDCPNLFNKVLPALPPSTERDDWWRLKVYTTETKAGSPVVEVAILKTLNGETKEIGYGYSRKFDFIPCSASKIALWSRNGDCQFKNFVLSYKD